METAAEELIQTAEAVGDDKKDKLVHIDYKMVTFSLAGKDYAIDIMKVKEIAKAGRFTYVPNTAPFVLGVYNLRGDIIPIIDLRLFFNIDVPARKSDALENMLIVSVEDQTFGVVVDEIDKVVGIQKSAIQPPHPLFGDINIKYIYGIIESTQRLYVLLDIDRIFSSRLTRSEEEAASALAEEAPPMPVAMPPVSAPPAEAEERAEDNEVNFNFVVDSLAKMKKFILSDLNEAWTRGRFTEWLKERGPSAVQIQNEQEADAFLDPFYSQFTGSLWPQNYADALFKLLPNNTAKQISVWNPGCAKGYESYSLACLLKKRYPAAKIKIYAQDIDLICVSNAPLLSIPQQKLISWYQPYVTKSVSGDYTFAQDIKDMILFEYHDCMNTSAMPPADIIFARDIISFLPKNTQTTLLSDFDEKLKGNGVLVIGDHESLVKHQQWAEHTADSITIYTKQ